jgi:hypothetical protein
MRTLAATLLAITTAVALAACGSESKGSWCPGTVCLNCATDPACNVTCGAGKTAACVGGAYFGADPNLRCGFCQ